MIMFLCKSESSIAILPCNGLIHYTYNKVYWPNCIMLIDTMGSVLTCQTRDYQLLNITTQPPRHKSLDKLFWQVWHIQKGIASRTLPAEIGCFLGSNSSIMLATRRLSPNYLQGMAFNKKKTVGQ